MREALSEATFVVVLGDRRRASALRADVVAGLVDMPKRLPSRWLYDERGCELFDEITELAEYYPTRREHEILVERASEIADMCRVETLVELGSGASTKTRLLLTALSPGRRLRSFVGLHVAESALRASFESMTVAYPSLAARWAYSGVRLCR